MKKIKKIISVLLVVVMAFSLALPAFAETEPLMAGDICESYDFNVKPSKPVEYTFTAPEKGIYRFNVDDFIDSAGCGTYFTAGDMLRIHWGLDDYSYEGTNYCILDKNETVTLESHKDFVLSFGNRSEFSVNIEYLGNQTIDLGETKISGKSNFYTFVPEKDGYYSFKSEKNETMATSITPVKGDYYTWNGRYSLYGNNGKYDESQTMLKAGNEYIIFAGCGDNSTETKTCTVNISFESDTKVDTVSLYSYDDGETILLDTTISFEESLTIDPDTVFYIGGVTVSVENEKIAEAEIDEDGYLIITAHKKGETMLTLTTETGNQVSYKIKVVSYISHVFSVFLDGISEILTFLRPLYDFLYT